MRFFKLEPGDVTVFHDEIDLAPGKAQGEDRRRPCRAQRAALDPRSISGRTTRACGMGVGHPGHKDAVAGYVLHDFAKADEEWLDDMLRGISDGAAALAEGDAAGFANAVALRLIPPRPSTGTERPSAAPNPDAQPAEDDPRSPLQQLVDRFKLRAIARVDLAAAAAR